ncbi:hypothetical protein [Cellulomonas olei]|uniref:hypothetical protein n=1 Tax=Cellulomonas sp. P4 TaxID=3142533 RepID=UPI0031BB3117
MSTTATHRATIAAAVEHVDAVWAIWEKLQVAGQEADERWRAADSADREATRAGDTAAAERAEQAAAELDALRRTIGATEMSARAAHGRAVAAVHAAVASAGADAADACQGMSHHVVDEALYAVLG